MTMTMLYRWILRIVILVFVLGLMAVGGSYLWLRSSLPQISGTLSLAGLSDNVELIRDK